MASTSCTMDAPCRLFRRDSRRLPNMPRLSHWALPTPRREISFCTAGAWAPAPPTAQRGNELTDVWLRASLSCRCGRSDAGADQDAAQCLSYGLPGEYTRHNSATGTRGAKLELTRMRLSASAMACQVSAQDTGPTMDLGQILQLTHYQSSNASLPRILANHDPCRRVQEQINRRGLFTFTLHWGGTKVRDGQAHRARKI
eukprot:scaffold43543_cov20-Tisochrysis_lutea.AAC.2